MFRTAICLILIADLLMCPVFCGTALCCGCAEADSATAPVDVLNADDCCDGCQAETNGDVEDEDATPESPARESVDKCDCLCKGAVLRRAPEPLVADTFLPVAAVATSSDEPDLPGGIDTSSGLSESGSRLRAVLSSYLC